MSNRLMWLLIVLAFILAGIGFYMYSFVTYTWKVIITTNVENYTVELQNKKTVKEIKKNCIKNKCVIEEVPPFNFMMLITKEWYRDYEETITVKRSEIKSVVIAMQKDTKLVWLTSIWEKIQESTGTWTQSELLKRETIDKKNIILSKKEKLKRLQNKKKYYAYFEIQNFWEIFFKIEKNKVNVYYKDELAKQRKIADFSNKVEKSKITVQQVMWKDHIIFIQYGEKKFLYNAQVASFDEISLKIPVKYIKAGVDRSLQFVTTKGTFIYKNKKFEYFSMLEDFVYRDWNYIWVVTSDDIRRKKNLNFDSESGTLIVLQNPKTKEKKVLLKPQFEVEKILLKDEKVVLVDSEGKEFSLENY